MRSTDEAAGGETGLRCSFAAEARGDMQLATAPPAAGFILIEHPEAWGHQALLESGLDPEIIAQLGASATAAAFRVLLVKRPGRTARQDRRRWAVARSAPGREHIEWGWFEHESELLELPLAGPAHSGSPEPCYLVCTHGRHDPCCALRGRPVATALAQMRPNATWECSHVGGDRFAGNVVVLPHGLYYGRVTAAAAQTIVSATERSEIVLELFRGRSSFRPAVQAAQHFARAHLRSRTIEAFQPIAEHQHESGITIVLAHGSSAIQVTVRPVVGDEPGLLTCRASNALHPPTFALERLEGAGR